MFASVIPAPSALPRLPRAVRPKKTVRFVLPGEATSDPVLGAPIRPRIKPFCPELAALPLMPRLQTICEVRGDWVKPARKLLPYIHVGEPMPAPAKRRLRRPVRANVPLSRPRRMPVPLQAPVPRNPILQAPKSRRVREEPAAFKSLPKIQSFESLLAAAAFDDED
ncbi:hypothetical protein BOTBODRAFT_171958 [Botryobasidium botryosum FD-172 SS1]|uniref:Uncharacterized protein n=1 Tax=Botryobasidium botryosum (strain FD-172 SS1) TaxID=930990 RepID=A0A067MPK1_BOTB1|nr:hypothetical protein BOTBODRAFT_171958 [Botryobasidium botryosum FD-172 SS1]